MENKPYSTDLRAPATDLRAPSTLPGGRPRDTKIWPWIAGSILVFGLIIFGVSRTASDYNSVVTPSETTPTSEGVMTPNTSNPSTVPNTGSPQTTPVTP